MATTQKVLQLSQTRATIILADGTVYYDSQKQTEENHLARPEVQQALQEGSGSAVRQSETLNQQMLYVAVRHDNGDWLIRIAMPFSDILAAQQRSLWEVWIILIGCAAALPVSYTHLARCFDYVGLSQRRGDGKYNDGGGDSQRNHGDSQRRA